MMMQNSKTHSAFILDLSNVNLKINDVLHMKKIRMSSNYILGSNDSLILQELQNSSIIPVLPDWYLFDVDFYLTTKKIINPLEQSFIEFISNCMNKSYNIVMTNSVKWQLCHNYLVRP